ncbi:MAG: hypothetical protein KAS72_07690 [Phycisphaerales bacterium]|nr:hypothetical protein [Phycisphaerales bacterium]
MKPQLIEPVERTPRERFEADLRTGGIPPTDISLLAQALFESGVASELREQDLLCTEPRKIAQDYQKSEQNRDVTCMLMLDRLANDRLQQPEYFVHGSKWYPSRDLRKFKRSYRKLHRYMASDSWEGMRQLATRLKNTGVDFERSLIDGRELLLSLHKSVHILHELGLIEPGHLLDRGQIRELGERGCWSRQGSRSSTDDESRADCDDPTRLVFLLQHSGASVITSLVDDLRRANDDQCAILARGIGYAISSWQHLLHRHPTWFEEAGPEFAITVRPVFDELDRRVQVNPNHDGVTQAWLRYAWMAFEYDPTSADDATRGRVLAAATNEIGRLRPLFRRAHEPGTEEDFQHIQPHLQTCIHVLYILGGLWNGMKPLLMAFRAMSTPCLAPDLSYWNTESSSPPTPWDYIPTSLVSMLHTYAKREQEGDPDLVGVRTEFARFCLDRLRTRKRPMNKEGVEDDASPSFVEPNPIWRGCFIRALRELHINPSGKGHHVLHWLSGNDPDEGVSSIAKKVYADLRHGPSLPKGLSPRRTLLNAFWWLSQAHLLALGIEVDPDGAQRTREEEARRTTESEDV